LKKFWRKVVMVLSEQKMAQEMSDVLGVTRRVFYGIRSLQK
jgi:hypothetical protein